MPEAKKIFIVDAPIQRVWGFLRDMRLVGSCVPGCEGVCIINEKDTDWKVRVSFGPLSKTIIMRAHTTFEDPPNKGEWTATGKALYTKGSVELKALSENRTEVIYWSMVSADGIIARLAEPIIRLKIYADAAEFAKCVKRKVEEVLSSCI
jgi:carbon monoxide dehydrogenase subunit G